MLSPRTIQGHMLQFVTTALSRRILIVMLGETKG